MCNHDIANDAVFPLHCRKIHSFLNYSYTRKSFHTAMNWKLKASMIVWKDSCNTKSVIFIIFHHSFDFRHSTTLRDLHHHSLFEYDACKINNEIHKTNENFLLYCFFTLFTLCNIFVIKTRTMKLKMLLYSDSDTLWCWILN